MIYPNSIILITDSLSGNHGLFPMRIRESISSSPKLTGKEGRRAKNTTTSKETRPGKERASIPFEITLAVFDRYIMVSVEI